MANNVGTLFYFMLEYAQNRRIYYALLKNNRVFLINGTIDKLMTAELSNWDGKALKIPRMKDGQTLKELEANDGR